MKKIEISVIPSNSFSSKLHNEIASTFKSIFGYQCDIELLNVEEYWLDVVDILINRFQRHQQSSRIRRIEAINLVEINILKPMAKIEIEYQLLDTFIPSLITVTLV